MRPINPESIEKLGVMVDAISHLFLTKTTILAGGANRPPAQMVSLPSPDEIPRRAEEARAKAQAALQAAQRGMPQTEA